MGSLSRDKDLEFPLLSDPFLAVAEEFVGTFDLGLVYPAAFGESQTGRRDGEGRGGIEDGATCDIFAVD